MKKEHILDFIYRQCYINLLTMPLAAMNMASCQMPAEEIIKNLSRCGILNKDKLIELIDAKASEVLVVTLRNNRQMRVLSGLSREELTQLCDEENVVNKVAAQAKAFVTNC